MMRDLDLRLFECVVCVEEMESRAVSARYEAVSCVVLGVSVPRLVDLGLLWMFEGRKAFSVFLSVSRLGGGQHVYVIVHGGGMSVSMLKHSVGVTAERGCQTLVLGQIQRRRRSWACSPRTPLS